MTSMISSLRKLLIATDDADTFDPVPPASRSTATASEYDMAPVIRLWAAAKVTMIVAVPEVGFPKYQSSERISTPGTSWRTFVKFCTPKVTEFTALLPRTATPTMRIRFEPVPTVWDHDRVVLPWPLLDDTASNVTPAP